MTEQAEDDLAGIWAFIAGDSPTIATRFIHELQDAFLPLLDQPLLGPARDGFSPALRVHFHKRYAIYYIPTDREIIITRVANGHRDRRTLFGEE